MGSWSGKYLRQGHSWRTGAGEAVAGGLGHGSSWQSGRSHIRMQINWEKPLRSETDHATQGSILGKQSLKTSD